MRFALVFFGFLFLSSASAQSTAVSTAIGSVTALGKTIAGFLPTLGGVSTLPFFLGLKGLALFKIKKAVFVTAPLVAPIAIAKAKLGIMRFKVGLAKSALHTAGQTTANIIEMPLKMTAVKLGALSGAISGAKGGLASYRTHPTKSLFGPFKVPAASLISGIESQISRIRTKQVTLNIQNEAPATPVAPVVEAVSVVPVPEAAPEVPAPEAVPVAPVPEAVPEVPEAPAYGRVKY